MGTSQSHTRRGEICHRSRERPFEWKRRLIERWLAPRHEFTRHPRPSYPPWLWNPCHSSSRPCFDSTSFRRDCSLSWITFTSWDGSWFYDGGSRYWALQNLISRFASFYFETDVFTLYLISNQNDFFIFSFLPSRIPSIFKRGWGRFNKINIEAIE